MKIAGYIRVSTEQQKQEKSHERQKQRLQDWAEKQNHNLDFYQDIAISGKNPDREKYQELMSNLEKYDAIVVRELSRFGRDLQTVLKDIETLEEENVDFISLKEDFNTESAMGKAMMQMIGVFNEFWANIARERSIEMVERKKEAGEPIGRPEKLDSNKIDQLLKDREKGLSYSALAKIYREHTDDGNLDRSTVKRYCDRYA